MVLESECLTMQDVVKKLMLIRYSCPGMQGEIMFWFNTITGRDIFTSCP